MEKLSGLNISEKIAEENGFLLYRGEKTDTEIPVIIKLAATDLPFSTQLELFQKEFDITKIIRSKSIARILDIKEFQNNVALIVEDIGAKPISCQDIDVGENPEHFLELALKIAKALNELHQNNLIHNGLRPSNILYNQETGDLQLTNLGRAIFEEDDAGETEIFPFSENDLRVEDLRYCSPELTGRFDCALDMRSDLYSLGILFYELLTCQLPFESDDSLQLMHAHLAKRPDPPHRVRLSIPVNLSLIVMKLLEKYPAHRYRNCSELIFDLEQCLTSIQNQDRAHIINQQLYSASNDLRSELLIGREREVQELRVRFFGTPERNSTLTLISGVSGTGKTALVHYFQESIVGETHLFLSGKADQYQHDIPYSPLIDCLQQFTQYILTQDQQRVERWRETIGGAIMGNGQVLIDVLPDLELIIGPQPIVPVLDPAETENRFKKCIVDFMSICCSPELPIILFLDDLQWVDSGTLALLKLFISDRTVRSLMIIGAFRHNEVDEDHEMYPFLQTIGDQQSNSFLMDLEDLQLEHIQQFLSCFLPVQSELLDDIVELCHRKTNGNPFFLKHFIHSLLRHQDLRYDGVEKKWFFTQERLEQTSISENVVSLILSRIGDLGEQSQVMLKFAAALGNKFGEDTISEVCDISKEEANNQLQEAVGEGFLLTISDSFSQSSEKKRGNGSHLSPKESDSPHYKFAHDQIQQAIYLDIPEAERHKLHLTIGRRLKKNNYLPGTSQIFTLAGQLNQGFQCMVSEQEKIELAQLNLEAGRKALSRVAYDLAASFFKLGLKALGQGKWSNDHYQLYLDLHVEGGEAFYLNGDIIGMKEMVARVEENSRTLLDTIRIYDVEIQSYIARNMLNEAIDKSLFALRLLKEDIPENPSKLRLAATYLKTRLLLVGKQPQDLLSLPKMNDPHKLAAMRILYRIGTPAYYRGAEFLGLLACKTIQLSLKHGNTTYSAAIGYATFAIMQCGIVGDINSGYASGLVALNLQDRFVPNTILPSSQYIFANLIQHYKEHLSATLKPLRRAWESGLIIGETEHAGLALYSYNYRLFQLGRPLLHVAEEMAKGRAALEQIGQDIMVYRQRLGQQAVENLLKPYTDVPEFCGHHYSEFDMVPRHQESGDKTTLFQLYTMKLMQGTLLGHYTYALEAAESGIPYRRSATCSTFLPLFLYCQSLSCIRLLSKENFPKKKEYRQQIKNNQKKLKKWAVHAPMNYRHLYLLIEAEREAMRGRNEKAEKLYDKAINNAHDNGYLQYEAQGFELAGKFYFETGRKVVGEAYLQKAYSLYSTWGAVAKTEQMVVNYPDLFSTTQLTLDIEQKDSTEMGNGYGDERFSDLDIQTMIKSSQTLASEIQLEGFLQSMLTIMIENAGAEKGYLFLDQDSDWKLRIAGEFSGDKIETTTQNLPNSSDMLPMSIVNIVARTGRNLVLENGYIHSVYNKDGYISQNKVKSVLCTPIISRGRTICVLYLENNLISGAFSPKREKLLRHLGYQAAISLRNAMLYAELEKTVNRMNREIQSHKLTRQQLLHSEKLSAMGRLSASIAHEFGNPLLGITFLFNDLQESENLEDRQRDLIDIGKNECDRLRTLIKKLQHVYKPSTGKHEQCSIEELLESNIVFYSKLLKSNNIELVREYAPELPAIYGVKDQLTQVIINLIINSVDAMKETGGILTIRTAREGDSVCFSIEDTGLGVLKEDRKRIFEPFYSTKSDIEGSGLGLSVSYGIVKNHEGTISVLPNDTRGACFKVSLPIYMN